MASLVKLVATLDLQSDVLGKEAGKLVKDFIVDLRPIIQKAIEEVLKPSPCVCKKAQETKTEPKQSPETSDKKE